MGTARTPGVHSDWADVLISTGDFAVVRTRVVDHAVEMDPARYLDVWRSHNRLCVQAGEDAVATLIRELGVYLDREHIDTIEVAYRKQAWTARRAHGPA